MKHVEVGFALEKGTCHTIEFSEDGSCVRIKYTHIDGMGFKSEKMTVIASDQASRYLKGYRFTQHELRKCF